jgi:hypothetical protein
MSLIKLCKAEILKQRKSALSAFVAIGPIVVLAFAWLPAFADGQISSAKWITAMWRMWAVFFAPLFMALYCGSLATIEHEDTRWDSLRLSVHSPEAAYFAKFVSALLCFMAATLLLVIFSLLILALVGPAKGISSYSLVVFGGLFIAAGVWLLSIFWTLSLLIANVLALHAVSVVGTFACMLLRSTGAEISALTPWGLLPSLERNLPFQNAVIGLFAACFTVSLALLYFSRFPPGRAKNAG